MRALVSLLLVATALTPLDDARADRGAPGTIFIAELQAGYAIGSVFAETPTGFAGRLTVGAGGKFRGWPTRIYGIATLGLGAYDGAIASPIGAVETSRTLVSWSLGVRLLTPVADNLRLLMDVGLGRVSVHSSATILSGIERYRTDDDALLVELGIGLQYRIAPPVSLGVRIEAAFPTNLDSFDLLAELSGAASRDGGTVNPTLLVTATWHL